MMAMPISRRKKQADVEQLERIVEQRGESPSAAQWEKGRSKLTKKLQSFSTLKPFTASSVVKPRIWLPTSYPMLDYVMGGGKGIPLGTTLEAYGEKSAGKTTVLFTMAGDMQKRYGAIIILFDTEGTIDEAMLRRARVDLSSDAFMVAQPEDDGDVLNYETVFKTMLDYLMIIDKMDMGDDTPPVIFLWDSVGGTGVKEVEDLLKDGGLTASKIGSQALALTEGMKNIKQLIRKYNVLLLACNQARAVIGATKYQAKDQPAGGYNWDHSVDIRFKLSQSNRFGGKFANGKSIIEVNGASAGTVLKVYGMKNKLAPPYREVGLVNLFNHGIDMYQSTILHALFDLPDIFPEGINRGRIQYAGNSFSIPKLGTFFRQEQEAWEGFLQQIRECYARMDAAALGDDVDYGGSSGKGEEDGEVEEDE